MRLKYTLVFLLLVSVSAQSQKLTGIWRGYFSSANGLYREGIKEEMYKYEVQLDLQKNSSVKGVTYSYKSTIFYGKANLQGIYSPQSKTLIIKETGLLELEIGDKSQPCLMTCYLDYSKMGKLEVLQGTFISVNVKDKGDCGAGKVYLERVPVSDFKPEDFLVKKKPVDSSKIAKTLKPNTVPETTAKQSSPIVKVPTLKEPLKITAPTIKQALPSTKNGLGNTTPGKQPSNVAIKPKPGAENNLIAKPNISVVPAATPEKKLPIIPTIINKDTIPVKPKLNIPVKIPLPRVLIDRENNLVKTIQTDEENIQIDLYDNGTIDHDSISVFHNNKQVIKNGGLSYTPITLKIKCAVDDARHELIMVAENMGEIPPNTALMVITAGKKRYEIFLTSTVEKNAKVVIEYKPKS